jgi:hypothetical protein
LLAFDFEVDAVDLRHAHPLIDKSETA